MAQCPRPVVGVPGGEEHLVEAFPSHPPGPGVGHRHIDPVIMVAQPPTGGQQRGDCLPLLGEVATDQRPSREGIERFGIAMGQPPVIEAGQVDPVGTASHRDDPGCHIQPPERGLVGVVGGAGAGRGRVEDLDLDRRDARQQATGDQPLDTEERLRPGTDDGELHAAPPTRRSSTRVAN